MRKKRFSTNLYFFLIGFMIIIFPGILRADLPQPLNLVDRMVELLPLFLLFWPIIVVAVTSVVKVLLLKRKLSVPWKLKAMEKLSLATVAETIVEFMFLILMWWFFAPAVNDLLKNMELTTTAAKGLKVIIHTAIVIPWYCILGTITTLVLINFTGSPDKQQLRRKYLKFSILISLILPVLIILIIAVRSFLFK